ncbi:MAG: tetratricopeptide repeat protein [Saprospiraceae bacterium]|nr:tetratricopeptide repeat protein [Saprospiraceae bacterium]
MNDMEFLRQISRVDVLLGQSRYAQAEKLLENLMPHGADNIEILKMMAIAKMGLHKYDDADQICKVIMEQHPADAFSYYIMSNVNSAKRNFEDAKSLMDESIRLEPDNPDFHAFKANLFLRTKDYQEALESADTALSADAENIGALNARSGALVGLGRNDEAFETIDKSLNTDPTNPDTHSNMGWGLLHRGQSDTALQHFKMALTEDPLHQSAKAGMLEAMKAKFPLYRYFLMIMLWFGKLKGKNQWIIIIGSYVGLRILSSLAEDNEKLWPYLMPVIIIIAIFFLSTWIFSPLMNLYLLTNTFGRYTLSQEQKWSAGFAGFSLFTSILFMACFIFLWPNEGLLSSSIFVFLMMIPTGSMYNPDSERNKKKLILVTTLIGLLVLVNSTICIYSGVFSTSFSVLPLFGLIAYQWYANYIMIRE